AILAAYRSTLCMRREFSRPGCVNGTHDFSSAPVVFVRATPPDFCATSFRGMVRNAASSSRCSAARLLHGRSRRARSSGGRGGCAGGRGGDMDYDKALRAVLRVREGRGFVVASKLQRWERLVITAGHCLPDIDEDGRAIGVVCTGSESENIKGYDGPHTHLMPLRCVGAR